MKNVCILHHPTINGNQHIRQLLCNGSAGEFSAQNIKTTELMYLSFYTPIALYSFRNNTMMEERRFIIKKGGARCA